MDYKELKRKALDRRRRIIYDNDGCDVIYYCKEATEESLLTSMMMPLLDSQVDSVFCNSTNSGFGQFTHRTEVGSFFTYKKGEYANNITVEFAEQGTDHLKIKIDFCRKHNMEVFWQLRMNDTHDGSDSWYGPVGFINNEIKNSHPEYMMSSPGKKPVCGAWSAVDFGLAEVRRLCFKFVEEVLNNYDFDGISLDFFRHPVFFKSTSEGRPAGEGDIDKMTRLIADIASLVQKKGKERGKGLLLAVRVPDSVEYCREIGLDIETWLREGYVDILITTSYIHLNDWEYSVGLGHKYGAKVYPSLDEVRIEEDEAKAAREKLECYRARAMNAWSAGADGIFLFNYKSRDIKAFGKNSIEIYSQIGSPETLLGKDKTYFASYRGEGRIAGSGYPHKKYINIPIINPDSPIEIKDEGGCSLDFRIGESNEAPAILKLRFKGKTDGEKLIVKLNGTQLAFKGGGKDGADFVIGKGVIDKGINNLTVMPGEHEKKLTLLDVEVDMKYGRKAVGEA